MASVRGAATIAGLGLLSGCFTGLFLEGRPCTADADCGPKLRCEAGVCGGAPGTSTGAGSTDGPPGPTTSTTGVVDPTTSTGTTTAPDPTSTGGDSSSGQPSTDDSTTGPACAAVCEKLDLLLVIDNSGSMAQWTNDLLQALLTLGSGQIGDLITDTCDLHVGVVTTESPYPYNPEGCQDYGALVRGNVDQDVCNGGAPYATETEDLADALTCSALVGSSGSSDERPIAALLGTLDPAMNDGCNEGFMRSDALLVVVMITDEDDDADAEDEPPEQQTPGTPQDWYDQVVAFKGAPERVVLVGLLGDLGDMTCDPFVPGGGDGVGAEAPTRILEFMDLFPRHPRLSVCADDYAPFIKGTVYDEFVGACEALR
jgi:hypothetical protein